MRTTDMTLAIFIFLIFAILYVSNILAIGVQKIKQNWTQYRCNPIVMPFAGFVGPDGTSPGENFVYCVQNMQTNFMPHLLKPVFYNLNAMGSLTSSLTDSINNIRKFFDYLRTKIKSIIENVFGVFLNIIIEFQRNIINIKDLFGKLVGILATFIYVLSGSVMTMNSAWKGPPGQLVKSVSKIDIRCFDPTTLIKTQKGEYFEMKDLKLGEILKDGTEVVAIMRISNLDENKTPIHPYYKLSGGEKNNDIYVSGTHLVYDPELEIFVPVNEYSNAMITDIYGEQFCCLITSSNIIPIGKHVFHDWEDNQGSSSKNIRGEL